MGQLELRTLLVSVRSIAESLPLYEQALGLPLKFRDGDHYAALDGRAGDRRRSFGDGRRA